ncbi:MAG: MmgE/PrpD family protein, partial [Burkholderiaceae bacterium]
EVLLRDGRNLVHFQPDRKGDPELPLSDVELGDKLLELAGPVIGGTAARTLLDRIWRLDTLADLESLG